MNTKILLSAKNKILLQRPENGRNESRTTEIKFFFFCNLRVAHTTHEFEIHN
jgi:hypothetical protein